MFNFRWCPAPDCCFAVIASECASCPKLRCERPGCHSYFCYHCKAEWHPNQTCDAARAQRSPNIRSSSVAYSQDSQHSKYILLKFSHFFMWAIITHHSAQLLNNFHDFSWPSSIISLNLSTAKRSTINVSFEWKC